MKKMSMYLVLCMTSFNFIFGENIDTNQNNDEVLKQMFQAVWREAMNAKEAVNIATPQIREELLELGQNIRKF